MDYKKIAETVVKKALKSGAYEAETYLENSRSFEVNVRNGKIETVKQSMTKGMGLTVFKDKKLGFSYTSDFSEKALEDFVEKTVQLSQIATPKPWNGLPDLKEGKPRDLDLYDPSISKIENNKKIEIATKVEKIALAYDKRIKNSEGGWFGDAESEVFLVSSKGISRRTKSSAVTFGTGVIAGEGDNMQSGYYGSSKVHFKDLEGIEYVAKEAGKQAVEKLGARPVKTQKVPVVISRWAAPSFWSGVLSALDGDSVFKKATFMTDYLNKPIASKLITLIDDPSIPRHIASTTFDGEGKLAQKNTLIDKGVLKMFIYDTITARKAGVKVNTIAQRYGYKGTPSGSLLNVIINKGNVKEEDIIKGIDQGFYVKGLRDTGTDVPTGNFSVGASGFWISKGELAFPVDGVTLGGNTLELMKNIELVADNLEIRGGLNSPSFKVSELIVGGK